MRRSAPEGTPQRKPYGNTARWHQEIRALVLLSLLAAAPLRAEGPRILIQQSPLAGSQYYALKAVWPSIRVGDRLDLVRETGNRHDPMAIRVEWQGQKLGYVPRAQNGAIARALDQGQLLSACVSSVDDNKNPWQRLRFAVFAEL